MIYILKESVMNGTVAMITQVSGIEADDFNLAAVFLQDKITQAGVLPTKITFVKDSYVEYTTTGDLLVVGRMESTPLKMLN